MDRRHPISRVLDERLFVEKILTSIPIKDAIRTSAVCRKMRDMWKSIPIVQFDQRMINGLEGDVNAKLEMLSAAMKNVLESRGQIYGVNFIFAKSNIDVACVMEPLLQILSCRITLKHLVIIMPIGHPKLKIPRCITSLTNLEYLNLGQCELDDLFIANSSFKKVERLFLSWVPISTPMKLHHFLISFKALTELHVLFKEKFDLTKKIEDANNFVFPDFVSAIPKVSILRMSHFLVEILATTTKPIPEMGHLTYLHFGIDLKDATQVSFALSLLGSSINLKTAKIEMHEERKCKFRPKTDATTLSPGSNQHLPLMKFEELEVREFAYSPLQKSLVALILEKSPSLRRVSFVVHPGCSVFRTRKAVTEWLSSEGVSSDITVQVRGFSDVA